MRHPGRLRPLCHRSERDPKDPTCAALSCGQRQTRITTVSRMQQTVANSATLAVCTPPRRITSA